jgi:PhzF family phenazine biosynthesis protein
MTIPYFEVFAFTDKLFAGNPAGVCVLSDAWLEGELMQRIAAENNLPETAFIIDRGAHFDVRWMSPKVEIDLCGHATLASAHVLFNHLGRKGDAIGFQSPRDELRVDRKGDRLVLDFPSQPGSKCDPPKKLAEALHAQPREILKGRDYVAVFAREEDVAAIEPDLEMLTQLDAQGVVVTAPGNDCDFVSRYFAPAAGIPEDPATGSTHCVLIPYWSQ